jgi:hypothetical protein
MDAVGFGHEAEEAAVTVEAPWPPQLDPLAKESAARFSEQQYQQAHPHSVIC